MHLYFISFLDTEMTQVVEIQAQSSILIPIKIFVMSMA